MDKPVLYQVEPSPSVRSVRLVAAAIGVELELRYAFYFSRSSQNIKKIPKIRGFFNKLSHALQISGLV